VAAMPEGRRRYGRDEVRLALALIICSGVLREVSVSLAPLYMRATFFGASSGD